MRPPGTVPADPVAVDRILAAHARAVAAGVPADWYARERHSLTRAARAAGRDPRRVLVAAAILSPRKRWEEVADMATGVRPLRHFRRTVAAAERALKGPGDPLDHATGPKVQAFARALLGDEGEPVIDVWSARVAGYDPERLTPKRYQAARAAYVEAAGILRDAPARVQARTWTWAREGGLPVRRDRSPATGSEGEEAS